MPLIKYYTNFVPELAIRNKYLFELYLRETSSEGALHSLLCLQGKWAVRELSTSM